MNDFGGITEAALSGHELAAFDSLIHTECILDVGDKAETEAVGVVGEAFDDSLVEFREFTLVGSTVLDSTFDRECSNFIFLGNSVGGSSRDNFPAEANLDIELSKNSIRESSGIHILGGR